MRTHLQTRYSDRAVIALGGRVHIHRCVGIIACPVYHHLVIAILICPVKSEGNILWVTVSIPMPPIITNSNFFMLCWIDSCVRKQVLYRLSGSCENPKWENVRKFKKIEEQINAEV